MPVSTTILKNILKKNEGDETVQTFTIKNDLRIDRYYNKIKGLHVVNEFSVLVLIMNNDIHSKQVCTISR